MSAAQTTNFKLALTRMLLKKHIEDNAGIRSICKSLGVWLWSPKDTNQQEYINKLLEYAKSLPEYGVMREESEKQYDYRE